MNSDTRHLRPIPTDDLTKLAAERSLYRRIELYSIHTAASVGAERVHVGCSAACTEGECTCSHASAPRRPRQPRSRPSIWRQFVAFFTAPRFRA